MQRAAPHNPKLRYQGQYLTTQVQGLYRGEHLTTGLRSTQRAAPHKARLMSIQRTLQPLWLCMDEHLDRLSYNSRYLKQNTCQWAGSHVNMLSWCCYFDDKLYFCFTKIQLCMLPWYLMSQQQKLMSQQQNHDNLLQEVYMTRLH